MNHSMSYAIAPPAFERCASKKVESQRLDDQTIRAALVTRLSALPVKPKAILQEVRVHNGNAIADIVTVNRSIHCYEIKGETDAIRRLDRQGAFYDLAFDKITLVTTANRLTAALKAVPVHWGVMTAIIVSGEVAIRYVRKADLSPRFDKRVALQTLWKSELLEVATSLNKKSTHLNRLELMELISAHLTKSKLLEMVGNKLRERLGEAERLRHIGDMSIYGRL